MEFTINFTRQDLQKSGIVFTNEYFDYNFGSTISIEYINGYPELYSDSDLDCIYDLDESYEQKIYDMAMQAVEDYE